MAKLFRIIAVPATPDSHAAPDRTLVLHLPLTPEGQINAAAMAQVGDYARAEMTQAGAIAWSSPLLSLEQGWALRPAATEEGPLWCLETRTLRPGDYLTLRPDSGSEQAFRIVNVEAC